MTELFYFVLLCVGSYFAYQIGFHDGEKAEFFKHHPRAGDEESQR